MASGAFTVFTQPMPRAYHLVLSEAVELSALMIRAVTFSASNVPAGTVRRPQDDVQRHWPKKTPMETSCQFVTATSSAPSRLKSPTAMVSGRRPVA